MKKAHFALALLGILAGTSHAQSQVTVYGLLDLAIVQEAGGKVGTVNKVSSGVGAGSRIGFKGSEDLGNGLSAVFLLESGFQADTGEMGQGGLLFGRQVYVGLQGNFGVVTIGRQYTPEYMTTVMADPFASGYVGDTKNMISVTGNSFSRMDNTVKYISPKFNGFIVELVAAPGEVSGDNASGRQLGGAIEYATGPLRVRLGYHDRNNDTATLKDTENARNLVLGAVYDFGVVKLYGILGRNKGLNSAVWRNNNNPFGRPTAPVASTDSRDALLGLTVPFGMHALMASYIYKDDRTVRNQNANQIAIGYRYSLSKRTELHASYARIDNRNGASYTVGSAIEAGTGDRATSFGIRHAF
ncbi:porin [Massilia varians]|uniref:Porin n=1 Tax=Massilia varians TaxID=457921 RepID=A0ABM8C3M5_9BURK|nr:porin [Massilia varians]BDT57787.1 porin [Massilia varians]